MRTFLDVERPSTGGCRSCDRSHLPDECRRCHRPYKPQVPGFTECRDAWIAQLAREAA